MKTIHLQTIEMTQHRTIIRARYGGEKSWIEFRGDGYHQWTDDEACQSPAQKLHDALDGMHACILHTDDEFSVLPRHNDYAAVAAIVDAS